MAGGQYPGSSCSPRWVDLSDQLPVRKVRQTWFVPNGTYLSNESHDIRSGREKADEWELFCEVNRRRRSRRGIRETTPNRPTVVGLWMHQCFGLSKCHWAQDSNNCFTLTSAISPASNSSRSRSPNPNNLATIISGKVSIPILLILAESL